MHAWSDANSEVAALTFTIYYLRGTVETFMCERVQ